MIREPIYDTSNVLILNTGGATIMAGRFGVSPIYTAEFETFLASTKENRGAYISATYRVDKELQLRNLEDKLVRFYPMNSRSAASSLIEYHAETGLVPVGDQDNEFNGNGGIGTVYYTTSIDFSSIITDKNNFTVWVYSGTDNDAGTDVGSSDGTNFVTISCKSGGDCVMKAGTVTITDSDVTTGKGLFFLNVQAGTVKAWKSISKEITELGTSTAFAGSLPSAEAFLCAYSNSGTATDKSTKRIASMGVYNGLLDDDGIVFLNSLIETYHLTNGTSVNYGA